MEKGSAPKADVLIRLSKYFNVSVDYLLGNEERNAIASLDSDLTEQEKPSSLSTGLQAKRLS